MVTDVDPETEVINEVDRRVSEIDDEETRERLEMKIYKVENPVWVTKITLEITKAQKGKECQLCEFGILTEQTVMVPIPQRSPWVYKADEHGVNFNQVQPLQAISEHSDEQIVPELSLPRRDSFSEQLIKKDNLI